MSKQISLEDLKALEKRIAALEEEFEITKSTLKNEADQVTALQKDINEVYKPEIERLKQEQTNYEKYKPLIDFLEAFFKGGTDISLTKKLSTFNVQVKQENIEIDATTIAGQILCFALEDKLNQVKLGDVAKMLVLSGFHPRRSTISSELERLVRMGALTRNDKRGQYIYQPSSDFNNLVKKEIK